MPNTDRINTQLDNASAAIDEYLAAGSQGRQERALVTALLQLVETVRELAVPVKTAKVEPIKAPAKKAPAKKAAKS